MSPDRPAQPDVVFAARLTNPCDIETRVASHRRMAWHVDCPYPTQCACPAHQQDGKQ
jgi:hypothetical protein